VRRALARIDALPAAQMQQPIELTPFSVEDRRGISLHIGEAVLFGIVEGDLDPEEKISLDGCRASQRRRTRRRAAGGQRAAPADGARQGHRSVAGGDRHRPVAAVADRRATALIVRHFAKVIDAHPESSSFRWARHGWALVQRIAQLLMGFLWLSVAYLWLTFVLARFPLTEPLGDRLTSFLFGLLETSASASSKPVPSLTTALVILFLTKAFNDALGNFFKAARAGRVQVPVCIRRPSTPPTASAPSSSGASASPSPTPSSRCPTATPSRGCR
jgi:hypothetical protein